MKAYKHLVKHVLATGGIITVWDGGDEPAESYSTDEKKIIDAIEAVELAELIIYKDGERQGWAQVIPFGLEDDETVSDHTVSDFFQVWCNMYYRSTGPHLT